MNAGRHAPVAGPQNLSDEIYEDLRRRIIACELPPGSKLNIRALCAQGDLNPGAMREALSRLTAEGLVDAFARRGFAVTAISTEDLSQLTEARIKIEQTCLTLAIQRGDVDWETAIVAAQHRLSRTRYRHDATGLLEPGWAAAHAEFHHALVAACDNTWLLRMRAQLYALSERYREFSVPLSPVVRDVAAEHRAIAEAVLSRDTARSADLIEAHLRKTAAIILDALHKTAPPARLVP